MNRSLKSWAALLAVTTPLWGAAAPVAGGESPTNGGAAPRAQPQQGTFAREVRGDDRVTRFERSFMEDAIRTGIFEVEAARLAVVRARSDEVKQFATALVIHHTEANRELTRLANRWRVELPIAPRRGKRNALEALGKKGRGEFDREFVQVAGIESHVAAIDEFQSARRHIRNRKLLAWLDRTLPVMRTHLAQARRVARTLDER